MNVEAKLEVGQRVRVAPSKRRYAHRPGDAGLRPARVSRDGEAIVEKLSLEALCAYVRFDEESGEWIEFERLTILP